MGYKQGKLRITLLKNTYIHTYSITSTGHNIKWDHFEILATGRSDIHCRIKESLLIQDLKPSLNENVGSEKLSLYWPFVYFPADFDRSVYYQFFSPLP